MRTEYFALTKTKAVCLLVRYLLSILVEAFQKTLLHPGLQLDKELYFCLTPRYCGGVDSAQRRPGMDTATEDDPP